MNDIMMTNIILSEWEKHIHQNWSDSFNKVALNLVDGKKNMIGKTYPSILIGSQVSDRN